MGLAVLTLARLRRPSRHAREVDNCPPRPFPAHSPWGRASAAVHDDSLPECEWCGAQAAFGEVDGEQSFFDPTFDGTQSIDYSADSEDDFGIFAGVEATFSNGINAFLELRTADESAVTIGISASF